MTSREQFQAAINGSPTPVVAAGLCAAIHRANLQELFEQLEGLMNGEEYALGENLYKYEQLKAEYTTV